MAAATNAMVKSDVDVKFKALGPVNATRRIMSKAAESAIFNARVVQALNKTSNNIVIADANNNIRFKSKAVDTMMQRNEVELRKALPQFDARKPFNQNIDSFHNNPAHQRNMLSALQSTSSQIDFMSASISQNSDNAKVTDGMATKARKEATEGGGAVVAP